MSTITLRIEIPNHSREWLQYGVDLLYSVNCKIYRDHPETPRITPELVSFNSLMNVNSSDCVKTLLLNEHGECKDISAALAAWYTVKMGMNARAIVVPVNDKETGEQKPGSWHCVIVVEGKEYDPNYLYGMGKI